jgi:hypothetical protein
MPQAADVGRADAPANQCKFRTIIVDRPGAGFLLPPAHLKVQDGRRKWSHGPEAHADKAREPSWLIIFLPLTYMFG